jgi:hypothetical protein
MKRKPSKKPVVRFCLISFFGFLFDLEDGGDIFLPNAGLYPNYTAL